MTEEIRHSKQGQLLRETGDPGRLRPWKDKDGKSWVTIREVGQTVNRPSEVEAPLTKEQWMEADAAVMRAIRFRIPFVNRINQSCAPNPKSWVSLEEKPEVGELPMFTTSKLPLPFVWAGCPSSLFYRHPVETEKKVIGKEGDNRPVYEMLNHIRTDLPKVFRFDTIPFEVAARRVGELIESMAVGIGEPFEAEGSRIYGVCNFPKAKRFKACDPTEKDWQPAHLVECILREKYRTQYDAKFYGPYVVLCGTWWEQYLDNDYFPDGKPEITLGEYIGGLPGIDGKPVVSQAFPSNDKTICLVQLTPDVIRMVNALDFTVVYWGNGEFRVLGIVVPQVFADGEGNCGISVGEMK